MSDWDSERKLAEWITNLRLFIQYVDELNRKLKHAKVHFLRLKMQGLLPQHEIQCLELDGLLPLSPEEGEVKK